MKDNKYVVLYVDDDSDCLDSTKIALEANGYHVETALSAEEGLKAYDAVSPDLVIVDLMMEEVDAGTNLARELKNKGNKAPVYMLSSVGDQLHGTIDHHELGLTGVFQKPVKFDHLIATIKSKLQ